MDRRPLPRSVPSRASTLAADVALASCVFLAILAVGVPDARAWLAGVAASGGPPAGTERQRVARVVDGDTLVLQDGRTVRILGLDAPETLNPSLAGPQPLGAAATARLTAVVAGRVVALEPDVTPVDAYDRQLAHVWLGRTLVAEVLVREGLAYTLSIPPDTRHADALAAAEADARDARRGVWGLPRPTPLPIFGTTGP